MSKINNQSNTLDKIDFVQDISLETAAVYSGGVVFLYEDGGLRGDSIIIGNNNPSIGIATGFNDKTSSIRISSGRWRFYEDANYRGRRTVVLGPGNYSRLPASFNDVITSVRRVG